MQLNPHFLFNSLNALSVLVREGSTSAASRMLELIADVLRQVLRADRPQEIPLSDEITFLEQYLSIEQVRFSDRLHVLWSVEGKARSSLVPSFVTQPLVENAIKNGVLKRAESGTIEITARVIGEHLEIKVRDDGAGMKNPPGEEGVGLSNTRKRLRTLYGVEAELTLASLAYGGTEATLRIPYREAPR
jgi:two-component system, LytTR family, sensor kinase